jgi:hypothetical protein
MRITVIDDDGGLRWRMVDSEDNPEPLVDGVRTYPDLAACCQAAAEALSGSPAGMMAVQQPSGRWRWSMQGEDGDPLAISSTTFDTAADCGYALHRVRHDWLTPAAAPR